MAVLFAFFIPSSPAQDPMKELTEKANTGFINFSNAQYEAAVGNFEEVIKGLGPMAKGMKDLEGLYFTLAASYFNLNNYQKSLQGFQLFQTDYPKSERFIDSTMAIAQCQLLLKNYGEAEKLFATLENIPGRPDLREQAIFLEATAYRDDKQHDKAIERLETLIKPQIKTPMQANGAIMLTQLLTDTNPKRAVEVLLDLQTKILLVENVVTLNQLAVKMGDEFYKKKLYKEAFTCYRAVRLRNDVLKIQLSRISVLEAQIENNKVRARQDPANFTRYIALNAPIQSAIAAAKKMYEEMQKLPDFGPGLYIRMANCYYELGKKWESVVVYDDLLLRFPNASPEDRENAMFAMVAILTEAAGPEEVDRVCSQYLKEFPNGKNKDTVGFFMASSQLQLKDPDYEKTEDKLKQMLDTQKESKYRAEMLFQLGYSRFMQGKFDLALADFRKYQDQFGSTGSNAEVSLSCRRLPDVLRKNRRLLPRDHCIRRKISRRQLHHRREIPALRDEPLLRRRRAAEGAEGQIPGRRGRDQGVGEGVFAGQTARRRARHAGRRLHCARQKRRGDRIVHPLVEGGAV